jgi:hypothetical protein
VIATKIKPQSEFGFVEQWLREISPTKCLPELFQGVTSSNPALQKSPEPSVAGQRFIFDNMLGE